MSNTNMNELKLKENNLIVNILAKEPDAYYDIFDTDITVTSEEIKKIYKKLIIKLHPDKNKNSKNASKAFNVVNKAFRVLNNETYRKFYDKYGRDPSLFINNFNSDDINVYKKTFHECDPNGDILNYLLSNMNNNINNQKHLNGKFIIYQNNIRRNHQDSKKDRMEKIKNIITLLLPLIVIFLLPLIEIAFFE